MANNHRASKPASRAREDSDNHKAERNARVDEIIGRAKHHQDSAVRLIAEAKQKLKAEKRRRKKQ